MSTAYGRFIGTSSPDWEARARFIKLLNAKAVFDEAIFDS
jgi:hypothetical protein